MSTTISESVTIVRLKTHGHRFELLCRRDRLDELLSIIAVERADAARHGKDEADAKKALIGLISGQLERVVIKPHVYSNAVRNEIATHYTLQEAFSDVEFHQIAAELLLRGFVVEMQHDREQRRQNAEVDRKAVVEMVPSLLIHRFSGVPPAVDEVQDAIAAVPWVFVEGVPVPIQAGYLASLVTERTCSRRDVRRVEVTFEDDFDTSDAWVTFFLEHTPLLLPISRSTAKITVRKEKGSSDDASSDDATHSEEEKKIITEVFVADRFALVDTDYFKKFAEQNCLSGTVPVVRQATEDDVTAFSSIVFDPPAQPSHPSSYSVHREHASKHIPAAGKSQKPSPFESIAAPSESTSGKKGGKKQSKRSSKLDDASNEDDDNDNNTNDKQTRHNGGSRRRRQQTSENNQSTENASAFSDKTHKDLQALCKKHGLSTGGKKVDLVDRLDAFFSED